MDKMDKYCRLCLHKNGNKRFFTFSHKLSDSLNVSECYKLLTSLNFENQDDRDNSKICKNCWSKLYSFYEFRKLALSNNDIIVNLKAQELDISGDPVNEASFNVEEILTKIKVEVFELPVIIKEEILETKEEIIEKPKESEGSKKVQKAKLPKIQNETKTEGKVSSRKRTLKPKTAMCSYCGKEYSRLCLLSHIKRIHLKSKRFQCDYCGKLFFRKPPLLQHMFRHINYRSLECDVCKKKYISRPALTEHQKFSHNPSEVKLIPCPYPGCQTKSRKKENMKYHINSVHIRIKNFVCECGKGFMEERTYNLHKAMHSDEKNFECQVCKERFRTKVSLKVHQRQTHEEPRYPCKICGKPFHFPYTLKTHTVTVHEGLEPFPCDLCGKRYTTSPFLKKHIRDVHFEGKISCELCERKLSNTENYRIHLKKMHKGIDEEVLSALMKKINTIKADYEKMEFYYS